MRLIPGEYTHPNGEVEPVGFLVTHYSPKTKKTIICSSEWKDMDGYYVRKGSCVGCMAYDGKAAGDPKWKHYAVTRSFKFPVTVVVMENFHLDPLDWDGNPLGVDDNGKPKRRKVMCVGPENDCPGCSRNLPTTWGRVMVWEMPETHIKKLIKYIDQYKDVCKCGAEGLRLETVLCPNCATEFPFRPQPDTEITCPACRENVTPDFVYECPNCNDPAPPTIFDADFQVARFDDNGFAGLDIVRVRVGPMKKEVQEMNPKPLDFDMMYRPAEPAIQAELLGIPLQYVEELFKYGDGDDDKAPF